MLAHAQIISHKKLIIPQETYKYIATVIVNTLFLIYIYLHKSFITETYFILYTICEKKN